MRHVSKILKNGMYENGHMKSFLTFRLGYISCGLVPHFVLKCSHHYRLSIKRVLSRCKHRLTLLRLLLWALTSWQKIYFEYTHWGGGLLP